jgi:hypothetical protein
MIRSKNTDVDNINGFYRGVVEDNEDPEKRGRVRARIFGIHTEKKTKTKTEGIPTNELPWSEPCLPIVEGGVSGFGFFSVPVQGSHIMIFFENGNYFSPRYFASLPGVPAEGPNVRKGFNDPDGEYPTPFRLNEPDYHRLSRGISADTLVNTKNSNRDTGVAQAGGGTWDEPTSPYNTVYPHNVVLSTHGGIVMEFDSTVGSKRFHIYHPSNTFIECDNDGNLVIKNNKDKYNIVKGEEKTYVKQNRHVTVDNDQGNLTGGNRTDETTGNHVEDITGNQTVTVDGNQSVTVGGTQTFDITGAIDITGGSTIEITATGAVLVTSPSTTLASASVILGTSTQKKLMNENMISVFNNHTHAHGDPTTGVPNSTLSTGSHATSQTTAS